MRPLLVGAAAAAAAVPHWKSSSLFFVTRAAAPLRSRKRHLSAVPSSPNPYAPPAFGHTEDKDLVDEAVEQVKGLLAESGSIVCLTGAGISTPSGVPDYRGKNGSYSRGHKPMVHDEFMRSDLNQRRYWARSTLGWSTFGVAKPNEGHLALAKMETAYAGKMAGVITQNVDSLHRKAGSTTIVDLHGRNDRAVCMGCGLKIKRRRLQEKLLLMNKEWLKEVERKVGDGSMRADGDVDLGAEDYSSFEICGCERCGHFIKPDVVFFGDSVPKPTVDAAFSLVDEADLLLVAGTSLMVYSGFRFVDRAVKQGKKVVIVNVGPTRADKAGLDVTLKVDASTSYVLPRLVE